MLSKQIEGAQKKVEEQNFLIRKRVLEYDDVMNQQREIIYEYRDRILEGQDMSEIAREQIADAIERIAREYMAGRVPGGLGARRAVHPARADLRPSPTRSTTSRRARTARRWSSSCART